MAKGLAGKRIWQRLRMFLQCLLISVSGFVLAYLPATAYSSSNSALPACKEQLSARLCEKIGQMLIVGFGGLNQDHDGRIVWQDPDGLSFKENSAIGKAIKNQHIGGVILFNKVFRNKRTGVFIRDRNIQSPDQTVKLTRSLKNYSLKARQEERFPKLDLLVTIDQEGGVVDRLPTDLNFPLRTLVPQALGANEESVFANREQKQKALTRTRQYATQMADELAANHFNVNFFPSLDVNINPLNAVIGGRGRSFSSNPEIVVDQALQFVKAFHHKNILATLKHFPGHGSSVGDTHDGIVDVTDTYQMDKELLPYRTLINQGYKDFIMTTHVINGQIDKTQCKKGPKNDRTTWCPGTMSHATLTKLLREDLGFKGVIVSDDMTMGAIAKAYPLQVALEKAINAGVDMLIVANNTEDQSEEVVNTIAQLVKTNRVSEDRINHAYQRIVELKKRLQNKNLNV